MCAQRVGELTTGQQQMLQIASAVGTGAKVIVFDEPTQQPVAARSREAVRTDRPSFAQRGVTSIYVSHRMEEIFRLCDTVTVLRDGTHVATRPTAEPDPAALVQMMIGRPLEDYFPSHIHAQDAATSCCGSSSSRVPAGFTT